MNMPTMKRYVLFAALLVAAPTFAGQPQTGAQSSEPNSPAPSFSPVTTERLLNAAEEPQNWLMYSGDYYSQRYSRLDQIDRDSAPRLQLQWAYQLQALDRAETTPLVVDGVMYVTESAEQRHRPRRQDRPAVLAIQPRAAGRGRPQLLLRTEQPGRRDPRRSAVHEHAGCPPRGARRQDRQRDLGCRGRR